jgi:hypothetical protein
LCVTGWRHGSHQIVVRNRGDSPRPGSVAVDSGVVVTFVYQQFENSYNQSEFVFVVSSFSYCSFDSDVDVVVPPLFDLFF